MEAGAPHLRARHLRPELLRHLGLRGGLDDAEGLGVQPRPRHVHKLRGQVLALLLRIVAELQLLQHLRQPGEHLLHQVLTVAPASDHGWERPIGALQLHRHLHAAQRRGLCITCRHLCVNKAAGHGLYLCCGHHHTGTVSTSPAAAATAVGCVRQQRHRRHGQDQSCRHCLAKIEMLSRHVDATYHRARRRRNSQKSTTDTLRYTKHLSRRQYNRAL
eukprot:858484-Prymnesium_polylepis.2